MKREIKRGARLLSAALAITMLGVLLAASPASARDQKQYSFTFVNGTVIEGVSSGNVAFLANAGGNDLNPTGMNVHVSCSDKFEGGFGQKDGPDPVADSAWQIASYRIGKLKNGTFEEKCSGNFAPPAPPATPAITIKKTVNGQDANTAPGVSVVTGSTVTLGYQVTNTGNVALSDIVVTDLDLGVIQCPRSELDPDETMTCSESRVDVTTPGQVFMKARVDATATVAGSVTAPKPIGKGQGYSFRFVNGTTISGTSTKNTVFLPNAGGTSANNPTGMTVHVSCSDRFAGGFGEKDGPVRGIDSAWQIASFSIIKSKGKKTCGETFQPSELRVMDMDPVYYTATPTPPPPVLPPPAECTVRLVTNNSEVKVSWDAVGDATDYAVRRNNVWLGRTASLMFTDTNPPLDVELEYFVRSINADARSSYTSCGTILVPDAPPPPPPTAPPICVADFGLDKVTISWDEVPGAKAYQVRQDGVWQIRTTELSWVDNDPGVEYTVEAVFPGEIKSARTRCEPGS